MLSIWSSLKFRHLVECLPFPNQALIFRCLQCKSFENTVGKGDIASNKQFLLFPQCFFPVWRTFCHVHPSQTCIVQTLSVWKSLKFVAGEKFLRLSGDNLLSLRDLDLWPIQNETLKLHIC